MFPATPPARPVRWDAGNRRNADKTNKKVSIDLIRIRKLEAIMSTITTDSARYSDLVKVCASVKLSRRASKTKSIIFHRHIIVAVERLTIDGFTHDKTSISLTIRDIIDTSKGEHPH